MAELLRPEGWGFGVPLEAIYGNEWILQKELDAFNPKWYMNWGQNHYFTKPGCVFAPMAWDPSASEVTARIQSNPGETWLLYNEPERPEQNNISPEAAADKTRAFLENAWSTGKEFQWAAAGVGPGTTDFDGLVWMTTYIQNLRRKGIGRPNYLHFHGYQSKNLTEFNQSWGKLMDWYEVWGAGAPIIISEVCAEGNDLYNQKQVMNRVNELLVTGQIAAASWFSSHRSAVANWTNAYLATFNISNRTITKTALGNYWMSLQ